MNRIEMDIQLNPLMDGISQMVGGTGLKCKDKGALVIGTNGRYRIVDEEEAWEIIDMLSEVSCSCFLGKTKYLAVYNAHRVLQAAGTKYLAGSAIVVKGTENGIEMMTMSEMAIARKEFESRIVTLCGNGVQFTTFEIG